MEEIQTPYGVLVIYGSYYILYSFDIPDSVRRRDFEFRLENGLLRKVVGNGKTDKREEGQKG